MQSRVLGPRDPCRIRVLQGPWESMVVASLFPWGETSNLHSCCEQA